MHVSLSFFDFLFVFNTEVRRYKPDASGRELIWIGRIATLIMVGVTKDNNIFLFFLTNKTTLKKIFFRTSKMKKKIVIFF